MLGFHFLPYTLGPPSFRDPALLALLSRSPFLGPPNIYTSWSSILMTLLLCLCIYHLENC